MKFKVIGFPRGGTHFTSSLFRRYGLDVSHEKMGTDGICDWRLCCVDLGDDIVDNFKDKLIVDPYKKHNPKLTELDLTSDKTLMVIRNPYHIVSTWSRLYDGSLNEEHDCSGAIVFMSSFIFEKTFEYANYIERSVDVFIKWYNLNLKMSPEIIIKVENSEEELKKYLIQNDLIKDGTRTASLPAVTRQKTEWSNDRISKDKILNSINSELRESFVKICDEYNY